MEQVLREILLIVETAESSHPPNKRLSNQYKLAKD